MKWLKKYGVLIFTMFIVGAGSIKYVSGIATVSSNVNGRELPIYSVESDKKNVALTFDAAWGNEDTEKILEILKAHNVHATFFITGGWAKKYPEDVKAIYEAGHNIGNHSENHKDMTQLTNEQKTAEIMTVHKRVNELTGVDMNLFRAPYGAYDDDVIREAEKTGYYVIQWDVDSLDWKNYGVKNIQKQILENKELKNGSIILCHNGAKYTAEALDGVIKNLKQKGYQIVPISQLIYKENYKMDVSGRQISNSTVN